jgi:hypothetical protein
MLIDQLKRYFLAVQVSADEVHDTLSSQTKGPILYFVGKNESMSHEWSDSAPTFPNLLRNLYAESEEPEVEFFSVRTMKKFVSRYLSIAGMSSKNSQNKPYNIWKKKPDFSNDYGSASKADEKDYEMLKDVNKGVFAVKLKAVTSPILVSRLASTSKVWPSIGFLLMGRLAS